MEAIQSRIQGTAAAIRAGRLSAYAPFEASKTAKNQTPSSWGPQMRT